MNVERARFNMIEQQIRPWRLIEQRVLDDMYVVKREEFVPLALRALDFADMSIPLGFGEHMLPPRLDAILMQAMNVRSGDRILEVGTGSGYSAALMAAGGARVISMERRPELALLAQKRLAASGAENVSVIAGDGLGGWPEGGSYDVIVLSGAVPEVPLPLLDQLQIGGRLLAFVGQFPLVCLQRLIRVESGVFETVSLFETEVPFLVCERMSRKRHIDWLAEGAA